MHLHMGDSYKTAEHVALKQCTTIAAPTSHLVTENIKSEDTTANRI